MLSYLFLLKKQKKDYLLNLIKKRYGDFIMRKKYKKEKVIMIDLSDRKNIKIIEAEKNSIINDDEVEIFKQQIRSREKEAEDFYEYIIQKELETKKRISDEEFEQKMKDIAKQHKILKYLLARKDTN